MQVIERTEVKLVLALDESQMLHNAILMASVFIFAGMLMFGADFRSNPNYELISAQNLNFVIKIMGSISILIGLFSVWAGINNRDNTYIFDKENSIFRVTGKNLLGSYTKDYSISAIKDVTLHITSTQPIDLPDNNFYGSLVPTPDKFNISLELEGEAFSEKVFLHYQDSNFQLMSSLVNTIRDFLEMTDDK